ncbi:MAG: hypothetical protein V3T31_08455, partial [candidate division Zixibacteria bacterium]
DLLGKSVTFDPINHDCGKSGLKEAWFKRDARIISTADILIPVSIRSGGSMFKNLQTIRGDQTIIDKFKVNPPNKAETIASNYSNRRVNSELETLGEQFLFHWTRSTNSAWPNERMIDYYRAVMSENSYPRTAMATLEHIMASRKLIASSRHMPGKIATVSFSGLSPRKTLPLMRYRSRYREMSFEPYAIGIKRDVAKELQVEPVVYYDRSKPDSVISVPTWLRQSQGMISDWRGEDEHRHHGDLDLSVIARENLCLICGSRTEAEALEKKSSIRTVPMFSG